MQTDPADAVAALLAVTDVHEQLGRLNDLTPALQQPAFAEAFAAALKQAADRTLHASLHAAQQIVDLMTAVAARSGSETARALGLRAAGNIAFIGRSDYQTAIAHYDAAAAIYRAAARPLEAAQSLVGKVMCLGLLGQSAAAVALGDELRATLEAHAAWESVVGLLINLEVLHERQGQLHAALRYLETARAICLRHDLPRHLPGVELNRAVLLTHLGELAAALVAAEQAEALFTERGQPVEAARARHNQALIRFMQGRYTEALQAFDQVRAAYLADNRPEEAIWVDLFVSDCLLQIGRYDDVLRLVQTIRAQFDQLGLVRELATVMLNEGVAHAGLQQYAAAHASLREAQARFAASGHAVWAAVAELEQAAVLAQQGQHAAALATAQACAALFAAQGLSVRAAQADLVVARAATALGEHAQAAAAVARVESIGLDQSMLWLQYQARYAAANLARAVADPARAAAGYAAAIDLLEQLRGRIITEFRADFLEDKQRVYADAVALALEQGAAQQALTYVERAKSRVLVDMIAGQLDLRIQPRSRRDAQLVDELQAQQAQRNTLYRRYMAGEESDAAAVRHTLQTLETAITERWHQLLIRNADYARDAALVSVRSEPIQPYLPTATALLDFFVVQNDLLLFVVTHDDLVVVRLTDAWRPLVQLSRQLHLNLRAVPAVAAERALDLLPPARALLGRLYDLLLRPVATRLGDFTRLIVVPHGAALHYLPFHALFDGAHYLCQTHAVRVLPSASLLHYAGAPPAVTGDALAFGYSSGGALPYAVQEAQQVADRLGGTALVEASATLEQLHGCAGAAGILHLATHGDFNQDNPLFSGLALADGQLTTLDVFNLRLQADLVTLSACQSGRSVVKGGDELHGLMRAFLYAGARALLLSFWRVVDVATLAWMDTFYSGVRPHGQERAMRLAQQRFITATDVPAAYAHPYFWAPFVLVGASDLNGRARADAGIAPVASV